jgi:hypothetical protein
MKAFEKDMILAIKQGTERAAGQKDIVWKDMEKRLEEEKMKEKRTRRRRNIWRGMAAVVLIGAVFAAATDQGRAAVGSLMDLFEPQRNIDFQIEGETENSDFQLHTGGETTEPGKASVGYVIYVDESRYYTESVDGVEKILPKDFPEDYPEVSMAIRQDTVRTPAQVAEDLLTELKAQYPIVVEPEDVTAPLPAIHMRARTGDEWNSEVVSYYLIDNTVGGTFIVEERYFLEAAEGHGARFYAMLEQFEIVPLGE